MKNMGEAFVEGTEKKGQEKEGDNSKEEGCNVRENGGYFRLEVVFPYECP